TSILPRALLGISATNFETIYVNIVTGEFNPGVIFYLGLFGKLLAYFNTGIYNFGNFFIVTFVLLGGLFILLKLNFKKAANPFIFYTIIQFALSGSIEELSYTLYGICLVLIFCKIRFGIHNENRY
ncbi:O59 family O-antigen polymerase, partial [Escherichia coli]|nr:O59 family O-antigen polymerase [Escherichia coli]